MLNEALNVVAARRLRAGRRGRHAQGDARGRRPRPGGRPRRRGAGRAAGRAAARRRRCAPATRCCSSRAPATSTSGSPRPRSRSSSSKRCPTSTTRHRRPGRADRADPRRRRAAVPARGAVPRAPAAAAEGRAALRPARLRQDADRQGGRQLAGQEGRRGDRQGRGPVVTSSTSRAPSCSTSTSARPSGTSGWSSSGPGRRPVRGHAGHRVLRRDGLAVPHPRLRRLLRRREHDRAAAAVGDRRRRGPGERHRHRRLQPRGHDRPGDPAARPARREDQDRAAGRRVGAGHLLEVHHRRRCRCTPTTSREHGGNRRRHASRR